MSVVKQLTQAFWIILGVLLVLVFAALLCLNFLSGLGNDNGFIKYNSVIRHQALNNLAYLSNEFVIKDFVTWNGTEVRFRPFVLMKPTTPT